MTIRAGSGRLRRTLKKGGGAFTPTPYVPPAGGTAGQPIGLLLLLTKAS